MTCAAMRGSQLGSGLSSAMRPMRTLVCCSAECSALLLAQPSLHDRWPCDHPQVLLVESLPLQHTLESLHLEVISCSVHCRTSKWIFEKQDL